MRPLIDSLLRQPVTIAVGTMLAVFVGMVPMILPLPFLALGLFVALMQTFIFVLLTCVYIGEVETNIEHHAHAHAHDDAPSEHPSNLPAAAAA